MPIRTIAQAPSTWRRWLIHGTAALLAAAALAIAPGRATAGVFVSVNIAPPALPVYVQPAIPGPGYIWAPGYWAWNGYDYYWVPGTWVLAPFAGALWTPGYWGWSGGVYVFHTGYWGRHVGFYGGINYGYGYVGTGYAGGYWHGGSFYYNRSVSHVTNNITNVYNKTVVNNTTIINRTSYNGGAGGISARATAQQQAWAREPHSAPVAAQLRQRDMASRMPQLQARSNHGMPAIAATPRAGSFTGHGVVSAHGTPTATAAHEARYAPSDRGALRSASYAPHADQANRGHQDDAYAPRENQRMNPYEGQREPSYVPREAPTHRHASYGATPAYRPATQSRQHAEPHGHPAHEKRHDDKHY